MQIPVCFAVNDSYAPHAAAMILSIMQNKADEDELIFYCIADQLSEKVRKLFRQMEANLHFTLYFIDFDESLFLHLPPFRGSRTTYFKFAMVRLVYEYAQVELEKNDAPLPPLDKLLYLDCDMVALSSLAELYATDLTGKYAAVVAEAQSLSHLDSFHLPAGYFNAGMILFNVQEYQNNLLEEKCIECTQKDDRFLFADQDIFNIVFAGNIVYVPLKWNCTQHYRISFFPVINRMIFHLTGRRFPKDFWKKLAEAEYQPSIVHWTNTKPWDGGCNSPFVHEYWKYASQTPFYEQVRFSWRRMYRNVLNVFLLGTYPIIHYLLSKQ